MEWFNCHDKLPLNFRMVIVSNARDAQFPWVSIGMYKPSEKRWFDLVNKQPIVITHWSELPKPPINNQGEKQ